MATKRKPPIDPVRWQPPPVDPLPDLPDANVAVVPVLGDGPEDVVVDAEGQLWSGLVDGRIVRISPDGGEPAVVADTGGRPLGMHVARDGRLLICDSYRGLLSMDRTSGKLTPLVESVDGRPVAILLQCDRDLGRHNLFHRVDECVSLRALPGGDPGGPRQWRSVPARD